MTTVVPSSSSGAPTPSSGSEPNNANVQTPNDDGSSGTGHVAYETHRKLLAEKKKRDEQLQAALDEIERHKRDNKEREEQELKQKEDYKKLLEIREKELAETRAKADALDKTMADARKLDAFMRALNGQVDRKYWMHIDTDQMVIDPSTGAVDEMSVSRAVEKFRAEYSDIIRAKGAPMAMPTSAPMGSGGTLTMEQWRKLPVKEQISRQKEVEGFRKG